MTDYTDLKRRLQNEVNAGWVPDIALEAAAAIAALEDEVARLKAMLPQPAQPADKS